ncbi:MAG: hypothetical protein HC927_00255 [Deltaproteobacteria bacterium]|nr:hypothetical protein [Deltaproteobacteria bacterium]
MATADIYEAYYASTRIEYIKVLYDGATVDNFVLRANGNAASGPPVIDSVIVETSTSMRNLATWTVTGNSVDFCFSPPSLNTWISWDFVPSGNTPPAKVKVVIKRQDELYACPPV